MNTGNLMGDECVAEPKRHDPIEQFILLAKGTRGAACCDLIKTVLEAPGVYVFAELLALPNIKELEGTPNAKYLNTLNLFAYGTYKDYVAKRDDMIDISDVMTKKLKHLTIVSMAIEQKCIAYGDLQDQLVIANVRDLEDMIIEGIYADIIHGKLDQRNKHLEIDYTIGRDIRPDDIQKIANTLKEWCESCETMLSAIENQIDRANTAKTAYVLHNDDVETEVNKLKSTIKAFAVDMDEDMLVEFKDSGSSNSSSNSIQLPENRSKRPKSKMMKPTASGSGGSGVKLHR